MKDEKNELNSKLTVFTSKTLLILLMKKLKCKLLKNVVYALYCV